MTLPGNAVGAGRAVTVGAKEFDGIDPAPEPGLTAFSVGDGGAVAVGLDIDGEVSAGFSVEPHAVSAPMPTTAAAPTSRAVRDSSLLCTMVVLMMSLFMISRSLS